MDELDTRILEAIYDRNGSLNPIMPGFLITELGINETDLGFRLDLLEKSKYIEVSRGSGGAGVVCGIQLVKITAAGWKYLKNKQ